MAVALHPKQLTFVGIEEVHPQLGVIRIRSVGADRLNIHTSETAGSRDHNLSRRIASKGINRREGIVVPGNTNGGLAFCNQTIVRDQWNQVASAVNLGKEVQA